ncbi:hypothetical protein [Maribacter sp. 2308TA10-17]|uniref:hypothetical protein n=1 Tax=Maribacter sp. 2308TA10-17 TaxID=3386276 RepID=UPI0039BD27D0
MKLSNEQIQYIDNYLQFLNVKHLDVRVELIDHLASEFETTSEFVLLEDFIRTKKTFVKQFQKDLHTKKHWAYQKRLFKRIFRYFTKPKYIIISLCIVVLIYMTILNSSGKITEYLFIASVLIPQVLHLYIYNKPKDMHKKIQSAQYILSIMSFPSLFLYASFPVLELIPQNPIYFASFWFLALISNFAGLEEVILCKRQVLQQFKQLVKP